MNCSHHRQTTPGNPKRGDSNPSFLCYRQKHELQPPSSDRLIEILQQQYDYCVWISELKPSCLNQLQQNGIMEPIQHLSSNLFQSWKQNKIAHYQDSAHELITRSPPAALSSEALQLCFVSQTTTKSTISDSCVKDWKM
jgi:hypothetical protein